MVVCLRGKRKPIPGRPPTVMALALALATLVLVVVATLVRATLAPATPALAPAALVPVVVVEPGGRWPPSKPGWAVLIWPGVLMRSWSS